MRCLMCGSGLGALCLELGPQPICNRFLAAADEPEERFPLSFGQCPGCGTIQMAEGPPASVLVPRHAWISYNEPERHLDETVRGLAGLGLPGDALIGGISFKDDSTLARLSRLGFQRIVRLDPSSDLGITKPGAGVEAVQQALTPEAAERATARYGRFDLLVVRHIFEHARDPAAFAAALQTLLAPGGLAVIECPDCSRALEALDYTTLWEEHVLYFTPASFRAGLALCGLEPLSVDLYPYALENSLVAVTRAAGSPASGGNAAGGTEGELARGDNFFRSFDRQRERLATHLREARKESGHVALFGAGHLACAFLNFLRLGEAVECVIDDDPHKAGLYMPGSRLPIVSSDVLEGGDIGYCLLSLSPESMDRVVARSDHFLRRGGRFGSIFTVGEDPLPGIGR